jgi:hypothetical protein
MQIGERQTRKYEVYSLRTQWPTVIGAWPFVQEIASPIRRADLCRRSCGLSWCVSRRD